MSNCSNHRKDLFGQNDMQHVAEDIGNLHYETMAHLFFHLANKLKRDSDLDGLAGRVNLEACLGQASKCARLLHNHIKDAWLVSKPYMLSSEQNAQVSDTTED